MPIKQIYVPTPKIIYNFGANTGDDIPYFLKKGDVVVAVEANPILCREIQDKFSNEIARGSLFVENCVLTSDQFSGDVPFYLHKHSHIISQFPKPYNSEIVNFEKIMLPSKTASSIIKHYGEPFYIKIDVENYDHEILRDLFKNEIYPPWISAESHTIEVFCLLVSTKVYLSFNLVDGPYNEIKFKNFPIKANLGKEFYSFPGNSSGPFGEDLQTPWMTANNFFEFLAFEKLGWKDIHASKLELAANENRALFSQYCRKFILKKITPKILRPFFESRNK